MTTPPTDRAESRSEASSPERSSEPSAGHPPEEFRARRAALRAACPDGLILIRGTTEDEAAHEVGAPFRQNSTFTYLTGVDAPGAFLVLLPEGVTASSGIRELAPDVREVLFLPARDPGRETWTGPKPGPGADAEAQTGIARVVDAAGVWNALMGWLRRNPVVYTLTPYGEQAKLTREYALMQKLGDLAPVVRFRDVASALTRLRAVKSPAEIERIRAAIAVTVEGQKAARALIASGAGRPEYEVEARVFEAFRSRGATPAFPSIIGAGINGTVLHYEQNRATMAAGDLVVVDIGARLNHYCGDLTRAYPVGGVFSSRQREIYALVLTAHERAVSGYRPREDTLQTLDDRCKALLKGSLLRAHDAAGVEKTMDTFMPHRLSHHLGLDVHDVADSELLLVPGNVITIEPGLYIPSEGIGMRIEDDYLVTATGLERLGPPLETDPAAVEAAMKS